MGAKEYLTLLRNFPPVHQVLKEAQIDALSAQFGEITVAEAVRSVMDELKGGLINGDYAACLQFVAERESITRVIIQKVESKLLQQHRTGLVRVINATGVVLHTNLGRAPLPVSAIKAMNEAAGYCNLEYDLATGQRGNRQQSIRRLLREITGAEDAYVVNNNAAAVFLMLNTFAFNKEVVVSRGEQVEIGGSFRIPDIIRQSGSRMVEVGTTNKTRSSDYAVAISNETAVLMKIHTSNFKIVGFTAQAELTELAELAADKNLLLLEDLGSGNLINFVNYGLTYEPVVTDSLRKGAHLVSFSGDKLLGGPQAGIIVGQKSLLDQIRKNPLARMVRADKLTLAALAAVLAEYRDLSRVVHHIPVLQMLTMPEDKLKRRADDLQALLRDTVGGRVSLEVTEVEDEAGGGALPGIVFKGYAVAVATQLTSLDELQAYFRAWRVPVVTRIYKERLLICIRTLSAAEFTEIAACLQQYCEDYAEAEERR